MKERFTPPQEIRTEHLLIRPFGSADEERSLVTEVSPQGADAEEIEFKNTIGCYNDHGSIFKSYAISFLQSTDKLIGTITLYPVLASDCVRSEHYRKLFLSEDKSKGFGTEVLDSVIQQIIQPALDHTVSVSTDTEVKIMPFHGHLSVCSADNYPSLFSNIKAGIGIDGWIAKENIVAFRYPPKKDAPDTLLMRDLFKTISAYDQNPSLELKSAMIEHLHNVILSTQEPHTIISAAHILLKKCEESILDNEALCTKLKTTCQVLDTPPEDGSFSWMQKIVEQQNFHYTEEDFKDIICAGETHIETPAH